MPTITNSIDIEDVTIGESESLTVRLPDGYVLEVCDDGCIEVWEQYGAIYSHKVCVFVV